MTDEPVVGSEQAMVVIPLNAEDRGRIIEISDYYRELAEAERIALATAQSAAARLQRVVVQIATQMGVDRQNYHFNTASWAFVRNDDGPRVQ